MDNRQFDRKWICTVGNSMDNKHSHGMKHCKWKTQSKIKTIWDDWSPDKYIYILSGGDDVLV